MQWSEKYIKRPLYFIGTVSWLYSSWLPRGLWGSMQFYVFEVIPVSRRIILTNSQGSCEYKLQLKLSFLSWRLCYFSLNTAAMFVVDHFLFILLFSPTVPRSPNNLMLISVNSSCVKLNWNAPGTENGEIAYYQVMRSYWMQRNGWLDTFDDIVEMIIITVVQPNYTHVR